MSLEQIVYREYTITLTSGGFHTLNALGDTITILSVTGDVDMKIGENPQTKCRAGITIDVPAFSQYGRIDFLETGASNASVLVAVSNGNVKDNRLTVSGNIDISKSSTLDTIADVTLGTASATLIAAADSTRREILITNMTGDFIRVGDSGVLATSGVRVADGASVTLQTTAAVYGFSTPGGDVSVTTLED